ncbi:PREDICTED: uncharacterized protein LOC104603072 isoform X2 [Nelumbo nucifera]|uniref:Uncharacterized protein LOC104603072 isoform X2 n=1 Tax=Nelumbo nucifera TaxID=4432 RepID=A0A1U8AQS3_NELNU|nr:PREDICTED: uncharacterized protein LOC104603072 isoform X2 [Nelumbo nucifera]
MLRSQRNPARIFYSLDLSFLSSNSSPSGWGKKRGNPTLTTSMAELNSGEDTVGGLERSAIHVGSAQAPLCRLWHRGDLMKRLAAFKAMTWFGKPKVTSAVNCARRGWFNVETDIIACEACLLFSTPWTQEQVEKAAAVFSLKLDNGHKLLCLWIGNARNETLVQFPLNLLQLWLMGNDLKKEQLDQHMKFDHKHFCHWIASSGNVMPVWQQPLSALDRTNPLLADFPSLAMSEVDDPITSDQKLFMSPSNEKDEGQSWVKLIDH